jgi:hypothetical protein
MTNASTALHEAKVSSESNVEDDETFEADEHRNSTSVMMCNIPNNFSIHQLLKLLDAKGFNRFYDFVYLPADLKSNCNPGYAFINFVEHEAAISFFRCFTSFSGWEGMASKKVCQVKWAKMHLQGLDANVQRYRNSAIMHESVPLKCKPIIFENGKRVQFPLPTKPIPPPKHRSCDDSSQK